MTNPITSTDFGTIRDALKNGSISLEDVARRFLDFKKEFLGDTSNGARKPIEAVLNYYIRSKKPYDCDGSAFWAWKEGRPRYCTTSRGPWAVALLCKALWGYHIEKLRKSSRYVQFIFIPPYFPYKERLGILDDAVAPCAAYGLPDGDAVNSFWTTYKSDTQARCTAYELSGGDVMNSFWTTYKQALESKPTKKKIRGILADFEGRHASVGQEVMGQLRIFARVNHTLGNFIPCQRGFNAGRYWPTMDYWDLTLIFIRDWYLTKQQDQVRGGAVPDTVFNAGVLATCAPWLNFFGQGEEGWKNFVDKNFLQPYVKDDYDVRSFFDEHNFTHKLPKGEEELVECLLSMNASIIARGNLMLHEIAHSKESACDELLPRVTPVSLEQLLKE